jgi:Arc/MetJ-type ribon-helix-helix transcriptional regulator
MQTAINCHLTVRLPLELAEKLDGFVQATGRPRSELVRFLLARLDGGSLPRAWKPADEAFARAPRQRRTRG